MIPVPIVSSTSDLNLAKSFLTSISFAFLLKPTFVKFILSVHRFLNWFAEFHVPGRSMFVPSPSWTLSIFIPQHKTLRNSQRIHLTYQKSVASQWIFRFFISLRLFRFENIYIFSIIIMTIKIFTIISYRSSWLRDSIWKIVCMLTRCIAIATTEIRL